MTQETLKLALEHIEGNYTVSAEEAITAIKEALAEHAMQEVQRLGQEIEQEPPKYSFKAHWEKDGRIGVVGAIVRPDGGIHLLQDFIDPPQRKPLSDKELFKIWLSVPAETEDRYAFARAIEAAHGIKDNT